MATESTPILPRIRGINRGFWSSGIQFYMACISFNIGIHNIWKFPYTCYNNGRGAFLIPYLLMMIIVGCPLFLLEAAAGQFVSVGAITMFRISPLLRGVGYALVVMNILIASYQNVILSYSVYYFIISLSKQLPFKFCGHSWNHPDCTRVFNSSHDGPVNQSIVNSWHTPAGDFFHNYILQISNGWETQGTLVWPLLLCDLLCCVLVILCVRKGINMLGNVMLVTTLMPCFGLFMLLGQSSSLDGAKDGLKAFFKPDWNALKTFPAWGEAASQAVQSLMAGTGGIFTLASYNRFGFDFYVAGITMPILNSVVTILITIMVSCFLGHLVHVNHYSLDFLVRQGLDLLYVTMPTAIGELYHPNAWGALFYALVFLIGFGSQLVQVYIVITALIDELPYFERHQLTLIIGVCLGFLAISLICITNGGMYNLLLMDWFSPSYTTVVVAFCQVILIAWIYGVGPFIRDIQFMIGRKLSLVWRVLWLVTTPIFLLFIFGKYVYQGVHFEYHNYVFSPQATGFGWIFFVMSIIFIPVYALYRFIITEGSLFERFESLSRPTASFGPASSAIKQIWLDYCQQNPISKYFGDIEDQKFNSFT